MVQPTIKPVETAWEVLANWIADQAKDKPLAFSMIHQTMGQSGIFRGDGYRLNLREDRMAWMRLVDACKKAWNEIEQKHAVTISLPFISAHGNKPLHLEIVLTEHELGEIFPLFERWAPTSSVGNHDPSSIKKPTYGEYLNSPIWQTKRQEALIRANHKCQLCGSDSQLDVHHNTYERFGGNELPSDLVVLCRPCHEVADKRRKAQRENNVYYRRLAGWARKVYGDYWEESPGYKVASERFDEWLRSRDDD